MMFKVTVTADRFTEESLAEGISVENGYVNLDWNRYAIMADEDDWFEEFATREEAEAFIMDSIGDTEQSGDSYYATDTDRDSNYDLWSFAAHIEEV